MTTERIAAAIKPILDEDRRADRERIAELERDLAALRARLLGGSDEEELSKVSYNAYIDVFSGEIDRLTEKCAALVVERDAIGRELGESRRALAEEFKASQRAKPDAPTLRIDPDMSDPQPGKLLVVRVAEWDIHSLRLPFKSLSFFTTQFVGFLVETPAVEVKEQGPWVVYDEACGEGDLRWRMRDAWFYAITGEGFDSKEEAQRIIDDFGRGSKKMRVITLAEARALEVKAKR